MKFGFGSPTRAPLGTGENIRAIATHAETLGFDFVSVADHVFPPTTPKNPYPYTSSQATPWDSSGNVLEMLTLMTFIGGHTRKLRLASGIMVVPLRNPLFTAKAIATLDVLTGGRVVVGCGVGWEEAEFEVLGAPPFSRRGKATDEYLRLFKELWTTDRPRFEGEFVRLNGFPFQPKPVQKPHPPLWIGGEGPAAMRRAARLGNGWYPIVSNASAPLDTPERYRKAVKALHGLCREAARDAKELELGLVVFEYSIGEARANADGTREVFTGSARDILDDVRRYRDAGVQNLMLRLTHKGELRATLERMEQFAEQVMAKV